MFFSFQEIQKINKNTDIVYNIGRGAAGGLVSSR